MAFSIQLWAEYVKDLPKLSKQSEAAVANWVMFFNPSNGDNEKTVAHGQAGMQKQVSRNFYAL